jgi:hypothetical protein
MKKYKLIKKYPGSPPINTIIENHKGTNMYFYNRLLIQTPNKYSEFWEEIIEKDYEILAYYCPTRNNNNVFHKYDSKSDGKKWGCTTSVTHVFIPSENYNTIHSVKRLSDGQIFTTGDDIKSCNDVNYVIQGFFIEDKSNEIQIRVCNSFGSLSLNLVENITQPILVTQDGYDIFDGDIFHYTNLIDFTKTLNVRSNKNHIPNPENIKFKKVEALNCWIKINKPTVSIKQLYDLITFRRHEDIVENLETLIRTLK